MPLEDFLVVEQEEGERPVIALQRLVIDVVVFVAVPVVVDDNVEDENPRSLRFVSN